MSDKRIEFLTEIHKGLIDARPEEPQGNGPWDWEDLLARQYNSWHKEVMAVERLLMTALLSRHLYGGDK